MERRSLFSDFFNGVDGATGEVLPRPEMAEEVPSRAAAVRPKISIASVDRGNLASAGWGVVFPPGDDSAVRDALGELLAHRQAQTASGRRGSLFREFTYQPERDFLLDHGVGPGPIDPRNVPYYLLLAGDPEAIPYEFEQRLAIQFAVGRIAFEDLADYTRYARGVVAAETGPRPARPLRATLWGAEHPGDRATDMMLRCLTGPLSERLPRLSQGWTVATALGADATRDRLLRLLGGDETPALLFTSSHGMSFPETDPRQLRHQGALLCSDWPGPQTWQGRIPEEHYVSGCDVGAEAHVAGLIAFHFACFSAGTAQAEPEAHRQFGWSERLAPRPFMAHLPQRLLARGALAVLGHVGRAWSASFVWPGVGAQPQTFESALYLLMQGHPVGAALEPFRQRSLEIAAFSRAAGLELAAADARGYAILGDPAVRIALPLRRSRQRLGHNPPFS